MIRKILFLASLSIFLSALAFADTLTLKSGQVIEGKIIRRSDAMVTIDRGDKVEVYLMNELEKINAEPGSSQAPEKKQDFFKSAQEFKSLSEDQQKQAMAQALLDPSGRVNKPALMALGVVILIALILIIIAYIYVSICLQLIAKKTNHEPAWLAWVPIANLFLMCKIAGISYWWLCVVFTGFIPIIGTICSLALTGFLYYKIALARGKEGWIGALAAIPLFGLIVIGYLAFSK